MRPWESVPANRMGGGADAQDRKDQPIGVGELRPIGVGESAVSIGAISVGPLGGERSTGGLDRGPDWMPGSKPGHDGQTAPTDWSQLQAVGIGSDEAAAQQRRLPGIANLRKAQCVGASPQTSARRWSRPQFQR
jgi:hypothetical protein